MRRHLSNILKDERGATSIEYALLGVFVSVSIIVGASTVGASVSNTFQNVADALDVDSGNGNDGGDKGGGDEDTGKGGGDEDTGKGGGDGDTGNGGDDDAGKGKGKGGKGKGGKGRGR